MRMPYGCPRGMWVQMNKGESLLAFSLRCRLTVYTLLRWNQAVYLPDICPGMVWLIPAGRSGRER